jgi:hypothetical protein
MNITAKVKTNFIKNKFWETKKLIVDTAHPRRGIHKKNNVKPLRGFGWLGLTFFY